MSQKFSMESYVDICNVFHVAKFTNCEKYSISPLTRTLEIKNQQGVFEASVCYV